MFSLKWCVFATPLVVALLGGAPAHGQGPSACRVLCAPELSLEPTFTFSDLFQKTTVLDLQQNRVTEIQPGVDFEMILAMGVPTTIPHAAFTVEAIWAPFAKGSSNPFTGYSAEDLGEHVGENPVELEFELNLSLLEPEQTRGWLGAHFDIVDQFSPAADPRADGYYTHKLDFELDVAAHMFGWVSERNWLRNIELETSLDYLATGLPSEGDEVPKGELRYLTDASPWSISLLFVIPLAPLGP